MTRNEALEILDHNWTRLVNPDYTDEELGKAQNMAIEALEKYEEAYEHGYTEAESKYREILERKHGEWKICDAKPPTWWYECSVCGNAGNIEYNYCPNCGADMRERREDDI